MTDNEFMALIKEKLTTKVYYGGYRQICELLGEEIYSGTKNRSKKTAQIRNWGRFFNYQKTNTKPWKVVEIYDKPRT